MIARYGGWREDPRANESGCCECSVANGNTGSRNFYAITSNYGISVVLVVPGSRA